MMQTLYHFTAEHLLPRILKEGLTLGVFPLVSTTSISFIKPCQWLTSNESFDCQSWNTSNHIKYNRNDYRLTIEVPWKAQRNIVKATEFIKTLPIEFRHIVSDWEGNEDWYLYLGKVNPEWLTAIIMKGRG